MSRGEQLRSPGGEYTVTINGLRGRALTPAFKHRVSADVVKSGSKDVIRVLLSVEDSLDQPFSSQYSSTAWPQPNVLQFRGSQADQSWNDELVIENQDDSAVPCVKVYTISNYDLIVAFDLKPKSRLSLNWKTHPRDPEIHFMVEKCYTANRAPLVYKIFPRSADKEHSYKVAFTAGKVQLDVRGRKRPSD